MLTFESLPLDVRHSLKTHLRRAFPDPKIEIGEELVRKVASVMPPEVQKSAFGDVLEALVGETRDDEDPEVIDYWLAIAEHTRYRGPNDVLSRFEGRLPMVRIRLPDVQRDVQTRLGTVFAGDCLLYTTGMARNKYSAFLDYEPSSVELVTPARYLGARMAAIAAYRLLGGPAYVLQAGMATGEARTLYVSPDGGQITRRSWYEPTPFSSDGQYYDGALIWNTIPQTLSVAVRKDKEVSTPHVRISVRWERLHQLEEMPDIPSWYTFEAACRVALIGQQAGLETDLGMLQPILAEYAKTLDWIVEPGGQ